MTELGITESFQVKRQVLLSAAEAAEMILRVDDIIKAAPRYVKAVVVVDLEMVLIYLCSLIATMETKFSLWLMHVLTLLCHVRFIFM